LLNTSSKMQLIRQRPVESVIKLRNADVSSAVVSPRFHTRTEDPGTLTDSSLHLRITKFVVARNTTKRKFLPKFTKREGRSKLY